MTPSSPKAQSPLHIPAGTQDGGAETVVDPESREGWRHTGLRILVLQPGEGRSVETGEHEAMLVPLAGACTAELGAEDGPRGIDLQGRPDVFSSATDVLYLPRRTSATVRSRDGGRFALCLARARSDHPVARIEAADIPVEVRGAGSMTRLVRNFGTVGSFDDCDAIIACEVITPGGNWSSYPAHKHDEQTASESELEEIYYYEIAPGPGGEPGFGFHRTTGADPDRPLDELVEVRTGDVVLVPSGWHGPCAAAPGHEMYYLNVMAGPGAERAWDITDHPEQTWVRGTWAGLEPDPRALHRP